MTACDSFSIHAFLGCKQVGWYKCKTINKTKQDFEEDFDKDFEDSSGGGNGEREDQANRGEGGEREKRESQER